MRGFITRDNLITAISVVLLISAWKTISVMMGAELILPPPEQAFADLLGIFGGEHFVSAVLYTVWRGLLGFLLSLILGLFIGVAAGLNSTFYSLIRPLLVSIRSTPVIAVILLAIIWFSTDYVPVFAGFLMMFPIICTNIIEGIRNVDRNLVEMAEIYRTGRMAAIREVYLPSITPFLIGGVSNAMGIGWKAVIAAEVLSQPAYGVGTEMHSAQTYLLVSEVIAWTIVAVNISYVFEVLLRLLEKKFLIWR